MRTKGYMARGLSITSTENYQSHVYVILGDLSTLWPNVAMVNIYSV